MGCLLLFFIEYRLESELEAHAELNEVPLGVCMAAKRRDQTVLLASDLAILNSNCHFQASDDSIAGSGADGLSQLSSRIWLFIIVAILF